MNESFIDRGRVATIVRATSLLMTRTVDADLRIIEGVASTASVDSYNDVVVPTGAHFKLPLPLLWHHDHEAPVGSVTWAAAEKSGIRFRAQIARIAEPGRLKDRVDDAWAHVKNSLLRAVSIGFAPEESEPIAGGGKRYTKWRWLELSLVTVGANGDAVITEHRDLTLAEQLVERALREHREAHPLPKREPHVVVRLDAADRGE
ncbi:HK97 family phage prohead protease [Paraburkholderia sp. BR10882]|uniref:HK97 family phage prohead protease n=1 Tax=unclassified Paraburkholderia TaxID=2615204 RepID=UPI0034CEBF9E